MSKNTTRTMDHSSDLQVRSAPPRVSRRNYQNRVGRKIVWWKMSHRSNHTCRSNLTHTSPKTAATPHPTTDLRNGILTTCRQIRVWRKIHVEATIPNFSRQTIHHIPDAHLFNNNGHEPGHDVQAPRNTSADNNASRHSIESSNSEHANRV